MNFDISGPFASDNDGSGVTLAAPVTCIRFIHARRDLRHPREREVLDVASIHLRESAIALPRVIAVVSGPGILERLEQIGRAYAVSLRLDENGRAQQSGCEQQSVEFHFKVTR